MQNVKLTHYAQIALGLAIVILTWVVKANASGDLTLPASVVSVITMALTILGLFSSSISGNKGGAS